MEALGQAIADARPLAAQLTAVRDALPAAKAQLAALLTQIETQIKAQIKAVQEEEAADVASGRPPAVLPELPAELWLQIFDSLRAEELPAVCRVCRAWRDLSREFQLWTRRQLRCYHTKVRVAFMAPQPAARHTKHMLAAAARPAAPSQGCAAHTFSSIAQVPFGCGDVVLGVGLQLERHHGHHGRAGSLRDVRIAFDLLSEDAFTVDAVRRSVWKAPFSCFLPLALEPAHFERAIPALRRAAQQAFGEAAATTTLLDLLAAAMNSMVVDLFKCCEEAAPPLHASEAALEGYCALHQLLLCSAHRWPEISAEAYRRVRQFLEHERGRNKRATPDLGRLLICLTLAGRGWEEMRAPFLEEMLARNVRWVLQARPELAVTRGRGAHTVAPIVRAQNTFTASRTSLRLVAFQISFLRTVGRPAGASGPDDVRAGYERRLGRPTASQRALMQAAAKRMLTLRDWREFFQLVGAIAPKETRLNSLLINAIHVSARRRYHTGHC